MKSPNITKYSKKFISDNKPLAAIVCGFPNGGTTLISEILRTHPELDNGFEGGFLLSEQPSKFLDLQPHRNILQTSWQINDEQLKYICDTSNYIEVYKRLIECSPIIQQKNIWIFDKTPEYMKFLTSVLNKTKNVPCILIVRDPRAVIWSWQKRAKSKIEDFCTRYLNYFSAYQKAIKNGLGDRILLVRYEQLCLNERDEVKKISKFIGIDWDREILLKPRYRNVYGNNISNKYIDEYKKNLSPEICRKILDLTQPAKDWFWETNS
jgi:hypothetical protein